jgi:amidase
MRFTIILLFCCVASAQTASSPAGKWVSNLKFFDNNNYDRLNLELNGSKLTGKLGNDPFEGTIQEGHIKATVKAGPKQTIELAGVLKDDRIEGTARIVEDKIDLKWEAMRETPKRAGPPQTHTFEPTQFEHFFSDAIPPVLRLSPGDTVKTWSVDAGGTDPKGVRRTSGGNPLTGPFFIEGALPGDMLVVHFNRIRLNRDSAGSGRLIVNSAVNAGYVEQRKKVEDYDANWKLDIAGGFASPQKPTEALKDYRVPLAPMLGCVGVAPGRGVRYRSGSLGRYGGNMDYNQLREGVTVYLGVNALGGLLFMGDGHGVQGAGELTGDALETSMDIEFTVDLLPGKGAGFPRLENSDYLMASGISGSLDDAFRNATTNLVRWIETDYKLNPAEASSVISTAVVYDIAEVVDGDVHIVAKIPKSALTALKKAPEQPIAAR